MKHASKIRKLNSIVDKYQKTLRNALESKRTDERARILSSLVENLSTSVKLHYELQALEKTDRVTISTKDAEKLSRFHYSALGMFYELANPSRTSLYELSLVLALADIVAAHSEKPEP